MKNKETSSYVAMQLTPVRNTELCYYNPLPIRVSSNTCSQRNVQIKHSLAHLQDVIPTLAGRSYIHT